MGVRKTARKGGHQISVRSKIGSSRISLSNATRMSVARNHSLSALTDVRSYRGKTASEPSDELMNLLKRAAG